MTPLSVLLHSVDPAGHDTACTVQIEPCGDGSDEWRIVPEEPRKRSYNRYHDKRRSHDPQPHLQR